MKKTIFISIITFIFSFCVFTMFFFPYDTVVKYFLNSALNQNRIPLNYSEIHSSPFGTSISGIEYFYKNNVSLGTLEINYSPLSLITKSFSAQTLNSSLNASAEYNGDVIDFRVNQPVAKITELIPEAGRYLKEGNISAQGQINPANMQGNTEILITDLSVATPVLPSLNFQKITASLTLNKNRLNIKKVQSAGDNKISMSGIVYLNYNALFNSNLNLKGGIDIAGMKRKFSVKGRLIAPKINF